MKFFKILINLIHIIFAFIIRIILFPFNWLISFKPDYSFQFNYGRKFCWIDLKFPKDQSIQSISDAESQRCYLIYLIRSLNLIPDKAAALVINCIEAGIIENSNYLKITESIFSEIILNFLTNTQRSLSIGIDFPAMYSIVNREDEPPQWQHYFKINKLPSVKSSVNFDSSPTDILLPLSCGIFYGYIYDSLSISKQNEFNSNIRLVLNGG